MKCEKVINTSLEVEETESQGVGILRPRQADEPTNGNPVAMPWTGGTQRDLEEMCRGIVESAASAIYIVQSGRFQYVSPMLEEMSGYAMDDLIGTDPLSYVHPDDREAARKGARDNLKSWSGSPHEFRLIRKHGDITWVLERVASIQYRGDRAVAGSLMDITEHKELGYLLEATVEKLKAGQEELSTPVIRIWDKTLALPLIGVIDSLRAQNIMETLLSMIIQTHSEMVVLDITGVSAIDTQVVNHIIKTIQAARLLGAECVITGIKPEIAQTMIHLGLDMGSFPTRRNLRDGLLYSLRKLGYEVTRRREPEI